MTSRSKPTLMFKPMIEPGEISTLSHGTRFEETLPTGLRWSHALLSPRLKAGDIVVDATAGNGHDTLFLMRHVLPGGRVFVFDVQSEALEQTRKKIASHEAFISDPGSVTLIYAGHETIDMNLPIELRGRIRAFMFNLGYLPSGDKTKFTNTATTLTALRSASEWLTEYGLITVVCYPGHAGGDTEADAVAAWAAQLPSDSFEAQKIAFLNLEGSPPRCVVIRKRARLSARKCD